MPSFVVIEEDLTDSKAHTYNRRRSHTIGSSNAEFHDGKKRSLLFLKCVWSHFRISSIDLKVGTTFYNIINSTTGKYCSVAIFHLNGHTLGFHPQT